MLTSDYNTCFGCAHYYLDLTAEKFTRCRLTGNAINAWDACEKWDSTRNYELKTFKKKQPIQLTLF